ncbi:TetR/AcrR family transcriptional regulator [Deinococcus navajonensis]|uniref:Helix-turn-helix domain-containing protein n=1 Tax=Deinococcus navajonensis TaxID=309884 RepID=A0ABV8XKQ9_9DEIO
MPRPRTISDEQLLSAAREVFLEQGFAATTASIARRAGVSEGTLFKRFARKEDLFAAAMGLSDYGLWRAHLLDRVGTGEVQHNLEQAALRVLAEAEQLVPSLLAVFSRGCDPSHNPMLERLDHPARADADALASYLQAEAALGRVRPLDADVTALTLVGALTHYVHRELVMPRPGQDPAAMASGRFVRGLMDVLWPGLKP